MTHFGGLKPDTLIQLTNWIAIPIIWAYVISMFALPWFNGNFDWMYVQNIWKSWQSLNVGMLAFTSSIIALNISKYNANKQRDREFVAAKAFLPEALSELIVYFKSCSRLLVEAWPRVQSEGNLLKTPLENVPPDTPTYYKEIFSNCIKYAEHDVGDRLAFILMRLQIQRARIKSFSEMFAPDSEMIPTLGNALSYFYDLALLQALVSKLYPFARGMDKFDSSLPTYDKIVNAYQNFDMHPEDYEGLLEDARRRNDT